MCQRTMVVRRRISVAVFLFFFSLIAQCECFKGSCISRHFLGVSHMSTFARGRHTPSSFAFPSKYRRKNRLTTTRSDDSEPKIGAFRKAAIKFRARPGTYLLIPCVAALVGWLTNWLAVQMIFYPVKFRGIPIYQKAEAPLGLIGWQGIVPCKTKPMSEAMVEMVTSQLLTVEEAFARLDPKQVAKLLAPEVPQLTNNILADILPKYITALPGAIFNGLDSVSKRVIHHFNFRFLEQLTRSMQADIDKVFDLRACVVNQMLADRSKLGDLFKICGQKELNFLTNSGLWFGFLLGLIQMAVALFWDNPWSLSIGGGIVGLATNWLALKWIFEPVDPTRIGPFILQGQFLRRQAEVAKEFSAFFANKILTAEQLWHSVLNDPSTRPEFTAMFTNHFTGFVRKVTGGLMVELEPQTMLMACNRALDKLPDHLPVLFPYMDKTLNLESTLRVKMEQMTSRQFERVLHPIFEEDELTLILAGAALGFAAGLVQQGLETGTIKCPDIIGSVRRLCKNPAGEFDSLIKKLRGGLTCFASTVRSRASRLATFVKHQVRRRNRNQTDSEREETEPDQ